MQTISIGTATDAMIIVHYLYEGLSRLLEEGVKVTIERQKRGPLTFIVCTMEDPAPGLPATPRDIYCYYIASGLTDFILNHYEMKMVKQIVSRQYKAWNEAEQRAIIDQVISTLQDESANSRQEGEARLSRKASIMYTLLDYFSLHDHLILEGFMRFRLKGQHRHLQHLVHQAADTARMEKEYREFIGLLKYFVGLQEPRTQVVHVIIRSGGIFRLLDNNLAVIDNEYLEGFVANMVQHNIDYEDLLISALITIAPHHIVLHFGREWAITRTIKHIFEDRVEICSGCKLCEQTLKAYEQARRSRTTDY